MLKFSKIAFLSLLVFSCFSFYFSNKTLVTDRLRTVVIDAGHGGKDTGCNQGTDAEEKKVALKVALKLGELIENNYENVEVIYTRKRDEFVDLHERSAIANRNKADLFISIHCNSNPNATAFGSETFAMGMHKTDDNLAVAKRENSVILKEKNNAKNYGGFDPNSPLAYIMLKNRQNAHINTSLRFAQKIQNEFKNHAERKSRGVHQAGFLVLWETNMPSVLIEIGFLSNPKEENYLKTDHGQDKISESIYRAFSKFKKEIDHS
jgi:N-acetylmuramoyl-L-alanine amidase